MENDIEEIPTEAKSVEDNPDLQENKKSFNCDFCDRYYTTKGYSKLDKLNILCQNPLSGTFYHSQ